MTSKINKHLGEVPIGITTGTGHKPYSLEPVERLNDYRLERVLYLAVVKNDYALFYDCAVEINKRKSNGRTETT